MQVRWPPDLPAGAGILANAAVPRSHGPLQSSERAGRELEQGEAGGQQARGSRPRARW